MYVMPTRLGHVSEKGLRTILNKIFLDDISNYFVGKIDFMNSVCFLLNKWGRAPTHYKYNKLQFKTKEDINIATR